MLVPSWGSRGPSHDHFEAIWSHVGAILGHFGAIVGRLGAKLRPSWALWEALIAISVASLGLIKACVCQDRWHHEEVQFAS